jgi:hypothetical protein
MTDRTFLSLLLVVALLAWSGLLLFAYYIGPVSTLNFFAFFLILMLALTCTFAPPAYLLDKRLLFSRRRQITIRHALRQGALLSLAIVLNLILRALDSWSILMSVVILSSAILIEVISLARKF